MFPYRGLFLAVIISLTSIVLADVIVQPGYEHSGKSPYYSQPASHQINSQTEQYPKQLPNQESRYLQSARTVYPYESKDYSNLVGYSRYQPFHHSPYRYSPRSHPQYARIGTHEYSRPSVFVGYPEPYSTGHQWGSPHWGGSYGGGSYGDGSHWGGSHGGGSHWGGPHHHRYRRSLDSDSTNTESSESTIVAHDNDVASKSPLTDDKHPKDTDSLLPEHEPTDTNDKHVENRQTTIDHIMQPRLFGIYPQNIRFPEEHPTKNTMQQGFVRFPSNPCTAHFDDESSWKNEQACINDQKSRLLSNTPSARIRFEQVLKPSNDDYDSKYFLESRDASPRTFAEDFSKVLVENMRHQWPGFYHVYTPSYTSPAPKQKQTLLAAYTELLNKYLALSRIFNGMGIYMPAGAIRVYHPSYLQLFPKRIQQAAYFELLDIYLVLLQLAKDSGINMDESRQDKMESYTSLIPDTAEITRYFEQDLPESSLVSNSDKDNYPNYCPNCRTDTPNYSSNFEDNSEFRKNSNSAHSIEPSISIPNYSYILNSIPNYDPNYAPDISVVSDYEVHKD